MPPLPSISALACGRKLSSSRCEVIESDSRSIHEVLGLMTDLLSSDNEVGEWMEMWKRSNLVPSCAQDVPNDSSDNGELGKRIPNDSSDNRELGKRIPVVVLNHLADITCIMDHIPSFFQDAIIKPVSVDIKDAIVPFVSKNVDKLNVSSMPSAELLSFVQSMTDVLDAATHDFYAFLDSLDSSVFVAPIINNDLQLNYVVVIDDLSCPTDCLHWDCHLNGESTTKPLSATASDHMKHVWKLVEWENGEATIKSHPTLSPNDVVIINQAPILMSFYGGSKDFGDYSLSLDHGENFGDPKVNYSVITQHDRELDNDGEIVMKLFAVIAADNPAVCTLFVPHAILPPCDQEAVIVFDKDASPPPSLLRDTWFALSRGEEDIFGSFSLASVDLDYIVRDAAHMTKQEDGHQSHACHLCGGAIHNSNSRVPLAQAFHPTSPIFGTTNIATL
jgi:hypothetical protein